MNRQLTICALLFVLPLAPVAEGASEVGLEQPILNLVTNAEKKVQRLASRLEACRAAGHDITYPDAALAVAELFCRFSRYDARQAALQEAAMRSTNYTEQM